RDGQLETVLARLARLRSGIGSVVVIEGGPGFGKTRLLREAFAAAIDLGIRGGHGMADPLDRVVEFAPLLEALFENDPPLFDRRLLSDQHAAPEQRFWLLQDLEALLERAAMEQPLLLCLDDLHWADNGTAAALRFLPKRLAGLPIAWLLSARPGQGSPQMEAALAEIVADGATKVVLDALSDEAVEQVVTDLLAARPDEAVLRAAERTRGNPFLLVELVRGLAEERFVAVVSGRATLTEDRMPTRTSGDMRKRLAQLPAIGERVAVTASSLGRRLAISASRTCPPLCGSSSMLASSPRATIGWRSSTTWSEMRSGRVCRPQCDANSIGVAPMCCSRAAPCRSRSRSSSRAAPNQVTRSRSRL